MYCKTYYIETLLRLNKFCEGTKILNEILKNGNTDARNFPKLMYCLNLYHMSIIKYKQKEYRLSLKRFAEFFKHMK